MQVNVCWKRKRKESYLDLELVVDKWDVKYKEDTNTGEEEIVETFQGQIPIGKTTEQKYLGFVLSSNGHNMANINALKKKSIGIVKKITNQLESLSLMNYYFECFITFLNKSYSNYGQQYNKYPVEIIYQQQKSSPIGILAI